MDQEIEFRLDQSYLQSHHKCDPLIEGCVGGIILDLLKDFSVVGIMFVILLPRSPCPPDPRYI